MYACVLLEAKFLDDWGETADKSWGGTHTHFTRQFNKERRKLERNKSHKNYEISGVFREAPHTLEIPQGGETGTTTYNSFIAAMEYAAELEEKANAQAKCIIEIEAIVDGQTVLANTTNYAASAVATGTNRELNNIKAMMK